MKTSRKMCYQSLKALLNAPEPCDKDEVRSLLGMVNYYGKFIPKASTLLHPLNALLRKDHDFKWTKQCSEAFQKIKTEIASDKVL